jgi:2-hydroxy-3-keto-5-methylthiopentenyl-1-phosphate phosphatase
VLRTKTRGTPNAGVGVFVDFDGTISVGDTTDLILERFADPSWQAVEADWVAGRIGSRECLARQIDLIRATPETLDTFARKSAIDPHFAGFAALCAAHGLPVTVVSDGLDRVASAMLARAGLQLPIIANHLEWLGEDRWRLGFPHARDDCRASAGHCKCATLAAAPGALRVLIGDGRSDFCAASTADLVIAKGALAVYCGNNAIPFEPFTDFAGATTVLVRWLAAVGRSARTPSEEAAHAPTTA